MKKIKGMLFLYHRPILVKDATAINDHINAFKQYSKYAVYQVNTEMGFPKKLHGLEFEIIVMHYSLFGLIVQNELKEHFYDYVKNCNSTFKICFFQDEYRFCKIRFNLINDLNIDMIYTLIEPHQYDLVYKKYTKVNNIKTCLTGYIGEDLIQMGNKYAKNDGDRSIDIGYRGRVLPFYMGLGAQEKARIGVDFKRLCNNNKINLNLDIEFEENKRIYGDGWYRFIGSCRSVLGVESGVSLFDIEDVVYKNCEIYLKEKPNATFEEVYDLILKPWENNIPNRVISPRNFEAIALKTCQIMFEGHYLDMFKPMDHYIPLRKDFSNFDDAIEMFLDKELRKKISERCYEEFILSNKFTYKSFINSFDRELNDIGFKPDKSQNEFEKIQSLLTKDETKRLIKTYAWRFRHKNFPGRSILTRIKKHLV